MYHYFELQECLCEDVRGHFFCGAVFHFDVPILDCLVDKVKVYVDVFRVSVVIVVCGKLKCGLVVTIEGGRN